MNASELRRYLVRQGCTVVPKPGGGTGHLFVYREVDGVTCHSELPMHGSRQQLGTKLVNRILKDLKLK